MLDIEHFKKTKDYRIICYSIKHIDNVDTRIDFLRKVGYNVSIKKINNKGKFFSKRIYYDEQERLHMQVSNLVINKKHFWDIIFK